jgi:hypothetical protein
LFLHDNVPPHRALATQKKLAYLDLQCLDHPPYSQDLDPSNYHLFPGLKKKQLKVFHFSSDTLIIAATETWLDEQFSEYFLRGLQRLKQRVKSVLSFVGKKIPNLVAVACILPGRPKDLPAPLV